MSFSLPNRDCVWGAEAALVFVRESKYTESLVWGTPEPKREAARICDKRNTSTKKFLLHPKTQVPIR